MTTEVKGRDVDVVARIIAEDVGTDGNGLPTTETMNAAYHVLNSDGRGARHPHKGLCASDAG